MPQERAATAGETVIILNPASGSGDHVEAVRTRAETGGFSLEQTAEAGDAIDLATAAVERGVSVIGAAGGDGTVNEVVKGIDRADGFDDVELAVVPVGTGNNFAKQLGITDVDAAFEILQYGERRRIDVGRVDGRPFVNSCVGGLTAESSSETSSELKSRFGVLAYVLSTLRSVSEFEALPLTVTLEEAALDGGADVGTAWSGDALCVLVGNGRRFTLRGRSQANMEDGLFDVTIIEDVPPVDLMTDSLLQQLVGDDSPHIVRSQSPALTLTVHQPERIRLSLDGEIIQANQVSIDVDPSTLQVAVGGTYDPDPDAGAGSG